jgi:hypothetical protein
VAQRERLRLRHPSEEAEGAADEHGNGRRSKIRSHIEQVFDHQKARMGLFVRTIGIASATMKIGMANLAYNITRYVWHEKKAAAAWPADQAEAISACRNVAAPRSIIAGSIAPKSDALTNPSVMRCVRLAPAWKN